MGKLKKVLVCFNLENQSQKELYEIIHEKFNRNMSGGIRNILWAFFFSSSNTTLLPAIESKEEKASVESVL